MRWLLVKDLRILKRSPLLVTLLVLYPVLIGALVGAAVTREPGKPKVAFANLVSEEDSELSVGGETLDASSYADVLFESIDPVRVDSREEAVELVRSGEVLGALIVPEDVTGRLQSTINLAGGDPPELEVIYNAESPLKRARVEAVIESRLAEANLALSERLTEIAAEYIGIIVEGGEFSLLGQTFQVLGLERAQTVIGAVVEQLPPGSDLRPALEQVERFARLAADNLDVSEPILASIGEPVRVKQTVLEGTDVPLDTFAIAVAVTFALMFVTLLLSAGLLAHEREENAYDRLVRGLVGRGALIVEKVGVSAAFSLPAAVAMLGVVALFFEFDAGRIPDWIPALAAGAVAFAAMGVAIGAVAREIQTASLLAFGLSLPVAFLALVPEGSVSSGLYGVVSAVSALFPFKPTLEALDGDDLLRHVAHLAGLAVAFGVLARLALRRFG
jgi:ABC-type transport system involved in cytochrome c biogenesis permease component